MSIQDDSSQQFNSPDQVGMVRSELREARNKGGKALFGAFVRLSGPGWMQSALSLGGGSLAASLYLGIIGGTEFLWLQPLAVLLGVIMLSAVSYVVLSTGKNPFHLLNDHIGPVIAWGWLLGAGAACLVWAFPQFSLATAVVRENMLPGLFGTGGVFSTGVSQLIIGTTIALIAIAIVWAYDAGVKSARVFDYLIKGIVILMFLAFFGVLMRVALEGEGIDWGSVFAGFIPDFRLLTTPAQEFMPYLNAVDPAYREFWIDLIASEQRDLIISTAAVVVGVNSTVLLSYSMLKKGWDREFRGLAIYDMLTGLFLPFMLITACMVIVSASLFHTEPVEGLLDENITASPSIVQRFELIQRNRVIFELQQENAVISDTEISHRMNRIPDADRIMAAMLVDRDAFDLSRSLQPLTGEFFSHYLFGLGVLGLALSSIIIQMVTWGFVTCEIMNVPKQGWPYRLGSLPPALGILAPFIWVGRAQFWLVVPTSLFVVILLPIAYFSFAWLMNREEVLGDDMPHGTRRIIWNFLMFFAVAFAFTGCVWSMWSRIGWWTLPAISAFVLFAYVVNLIRRK